MGRLKISCGLLLIAVFANSAGARPQTDTLAICYEVKGDEILSKTPCVTSEGGGAGTSISEYEFKNKSFQIVQGMSSNTMNGLPYKEYMRDEFFNKTIKSNEGNFTCYKNRKDDFCVRWPK